MAAASLAVRASSRTLDASRSSVDDDEWNKVLQQHGVDDHTGKKKKPFIDNAWFTYTMGSIILLNALSIGLEIDLRIACSDE